MLLQAYANNYTGNAKINRLVFISEKTADAGLALSALKIAAEELKKVRRCSGRSNAALLIGICFWTSTLAITTAGAEHLPV